MALFVSLLLSGCASVDIDHEKQAAVNGIPQPQHVSVAPLVDAWCAQAHWNVAHPENPRRVFAAHGGSMLPVYHVEGDFYVTEKIPFDELRPGMAVCYQAKWARTAVCHVIIYKSVFGYVVRGLNNSRTDPEFVTRSNYLGVVMEVFR